MKKLVTLLMFVVMTFSMSYSQDTTKVKLTNPYIGVDLLSKFVWRGIDMHKGPSIQPIMGVTIGGFDLGAVGAFSVNDQNYQEVDLYVSYTYKGVSLGVTDYFVGNNEAWNDPVTGDYDPKFWDYNDTTTVHIIEGTLGFAPSKLPFSARVSYNFYGFDTNNSIYAEIDYTYKNMTIFTGAAFGKGIYKATDGVDIVSLGITYNKNIVVNDRFSIPVRASLVTNPASEKIYLIFGFSF